MKPPFFTVYRADGCSHWDHDYNTLSEAWAAVWQALDCTRLNGWHLRLNIAEVTRGTEYSSTAHNWHTLATVSI